MFSYVNDRLCRQALDIILCASAPLWFDLWFIKRGPECKGTKVKKIRIPRKRKTPPGGGVIPPINQKPKL
jgi:hypothetical protein